MAETVDRAISERKDELKKLSAWQKAILDSSAYGVISTDTEGVIATFNRTAEICLGYSAAEMIGKQTPKIIHDLDEVVEYAQVLTEELGTAIEPGFEVFVARARLGKIDNREWTYIRKDGSTFPVHLSVTAIRDDDQEIVGFLGTFVDLTERKAAQAVIRESESRYTTLLDNSSDAIMIGDADRRIIECNAAAAKIFGGSPQQIIGMCIEDLSPEYQTDGKNSTSKAEKIIQQTFGGETPFFEWRHKTLDGRPFDVEVRLNTVRMVNVPYWLATIRDVTERKRDEAERAHLIKELELRNSEMERFTYTISHELKSPLVTISGFTGMLQNDVAAGDEKKLSEHIGYINTAVKTMSSLLEELLELSRIGRVTHERETVALGELAGQIVESIKSQGQDRNIGFEIEADIPQVYCDVSRIKDVYKNLVGNALKFTPDEPGALIRIGSRRQDDELVFYVQDNGIGIDPEYQDRIFGLFERLSPGIEGTGVGLTLVQRIIEDHNGRLWVESEGEGKGSTFCFTLPTTSED